MTVHVPEAQQRPRFTVGKHECRFNRAGEALVWYGVTVEQYAAEVERMFTARLQRIKDGEL